jgi:hypothetical protein
MYRPLVLASGRQLNATLFYLLSKLMLVASTDHATVWTRNEVVAISIDITQPICIREMRRWVLDIFGNADVRACTLDGTTFW